MPAEALTRKSSQRSSRWQVQIDQQVSTTHSYQTTENTKTTKRDLKLKHTLTQPCGPMRLLQHCVHQIISVKEERDREHNKHLQKSRWTFQNCECPLQTHTKICSAVDWTHLGEIPLFKDRVKVFLEIKTWLNQLTLLHVWSESMI